MFILKRLLISKLFFCLLFFTPSVLGIPRWRKLKSRIWTCLSGDEKVFEMYCHYISQHIFVFSLFILFCCCACIVKDDSFKIKVKSWKCFDLCKVPEKSYCESHFESPEELHQKSRHIIIIAWTMNNAYSMLFNDF